MYPLLLPSHPSVAASGPHSVPRRHSGGEVVPRCVSLASAVARHSADGRPMHMGDREPLPTPKAASRGRLMHVWYVYDAHVVRA